MYTRMGKEPVGKLILKMAIPAMISMLISALYNIVDMIFVSQISADAVTAVSLAMPLTNIVIGVGVGTGVGLNSLVSRRLGEDKYEEANRAAGHSIPFGLIWGIVFALASLLFAKPLFRTLTDDPVIFKYACQYTYVYMFGSFTLLIQLNNEKLIQATGNMIYPMIFGLVGSIINIVLDPILIHGLFGFPKMEVIGAAVATVIGQLGAMILSILMLHSKKVGFNINLKKFKPNKKTIKDVYAVGLPSIMMQTMGALTVTLINKIITGHSTVAVAVLGLYFTLQSFVFMPTFGITQGALPVMGYNYGARLRERLLEALKTTIFYAIVVMLIGTIIFQFFPEQLLSFFNPTPEMLEIGRIALRVISLSFLMAAINIVFSNFFQATGHGMVSMGISLTRQIIVIVPAAYILSKTVGLHGIWWAYPIAEGVAFIITLAIYFLYFRKVIDKHMDTKPEENIETNIDMM